MYGTMKLILIAMVALTTIVFAVNIGHGVQHKLCSMDYTTNTTVVEQKGEC